MNIVIKGSEPALCTSCAESGRDLRGSPATLPLVIFAVGSSIRSLRITHRNEDYLDTRAAQMAQPGVLSMARTNDPNSAGSQFFICLERVPHLDNQYTAFGRTADAESLAVVKAIGAVRTGAGDRPVQPVVITKATVTKTPKR